MRNRFSGTCRECAKPVAATAGYFERHNGGWRVRCIPCTARAKQARGEPLSHAQQSALPKDTPND